MPEVGASAHETMAILNHTTLHEAERYTRKAQRRALAERGMAKLAEGERNGE